MALPSARSEDDLPRSKIRIMGDYNLAHRLPGHWMAEAAGGRVRGTLAHPPALIRIDRKPKRASQNFALPGLRDGVLLQNKIRQLRHSLGTALQEDRAA